MDKFGLPERTILMITEYFMSVTQIETVKIFGSRARGNFKPYSDIDFVLYGKDLTQKFLNINNTAQNFYQRANNY